MRTNATTSHPAQPTLAIVMRDEHRDGPRPERNHLVAQDQRSFVGKQLVANQQRAVEHPAAEQKMHGEQQRDGRVRFVVMRPDVRAAFIARTRRRTRTPEQRERLPARIDRGGRRSLP